MSGTSTMIEIIEPHMTMTSSPTTTAKHPHNENNITSTDFKNPPDLHIGALGGIIVSAAVLLVIMMAIVALLCYCWHMKKKRRSHTLCTNSKRVKAIGISFSNFYANGYDDPKDNSEIISVSLSTGDYENIDFEESVFGVVSRHRLKSDYEATSSINVYTLPREVTVHYAKYHNHPNTDTDPTEATVYEVPTSSSVYQDPGTDEEAIYQYFDTMRFQKLRSQDITTVQKIGSGEFGVVRLALWSNGSADPVQVAVKTLNSECSESDRVKFLREAAIMGQFVHNNVVQLHGVVTEEENMMIVLEYMPKGDLRTFLLKKRSSKRFLLSDELPVMLLNFCRQIAAGMNYLANKQFVHRDLAARNILVSSNDMCKIADFGMARDVTDDTYYVSTGGKIPVRWTAPEALLYQKYSILSDIWSYGCVLFEIWGLGCKPFENSSGAEVVDLICTGYRLPPPPGCSRAVYRIMISCWNIDPKLRPNYSVIADELTRDDVLNWSVEDSKKTDTIARSLGGSLSSSRKLYEDLQNIYCLS